MGAYLILVSFFLGDSGGSRLILGGGGGAHCASFPKHKCMLGRVRLFGALRRRNQACAPFSESSVQSLGRVRLFATP